MKIKILIDINLKKDKLDAMVPASICYGSHNNNYKYMMKT